jgi:hypothetical protein
MLDVPRFTAVRQGLSVLLGALMVTASFAPKALAGEVEARSILKAMTTYVAAQPAISFAYDSDLEVITQEQQRLTLASSGTVALVRPNRIRATRTGGFTNLETVFDGSTFTLLGKGANVYVQAPIQGSIDHLVDQLKDKYRRPLPAADLLLTRAYEELMDGVVNVKDLGSGVIGGVECDHLAFRKKDVDFQIWIAQGDRPYPCRYVITSKLVLGAPQYSVQLRNWQAGPSASSGNFAFVSPAGARKITFKELKAMKDMGELPSNFVFGENQ